MSTIPRRVRDTPLVLRSSAPADDPTTHGAMGPDLRSTYATWFVLALPIAVAALLTLLVRREHRDARARTRWRAGELFRLLSGRPLGPCAGRRAAGAPRRAPVPNRSGTRSRPSPPRSACASALRSPGRWPKAATSPVSVACSAARSRSRGGARRAPAGAAAQRAGAPRAAARARPRPRIAPLRGGAARSRVTEPQVAPLAARTPRHARAPAAASAVRACCARSAPAPAPC
jgi:hypothetical protein